MCLLDQQKMRRILVSPSIEARSSHWKLCKEGQPNAGNDKEDLHIQEEEDTSKAVQAWCRNQFGDIRLIESVQQRFTKNDSRTQRAAV